MADKSICSNCGNILKDQWLVCKFCHQARWKMITPYFVWGITFLGGAWWSLTHKLSASDNLITLLLPFIGAIFGIIGVVMLLMALIATLRGLSVRKVPSADMKGSTPNLYTSTPTGSMVGGGVSNLNTSAIKPSIPDVSPQTQSAESELGKQKAQIIHCHKCKRKNAPSSKKCDQCGANMLPGTGIQQRLGFLVIALVVVAISFVAAFLLLKYKPEFGGKDWIYFAGLAVFGGVILIFGILWFLRITPLHERYATRAKRHIELNPWQAIDDYGSAINHSPKTQAFDYLLERAKLHQELGMTVEARTDWQHALENINTRIVLPRASIDLNKQRAEIYKNLGMEDEYAMEMLQYTIDKEETFKTKRGQIAEGWEDGLQKGSEDAQRQELQKLRAAIMINQKYKIVGQCKKCRSMVDLDAKLACTNNSKHHITNINPTLRKID